MNNDLRKEIEKNTIEKCRFLDKKSNTKMDMNIIANIGKRAILINGL